MWRQSRHRACLAVLMLLTAHCPSQEKAAHALGSERDRTFTAAAQRCLALPISDCAGLQALRAPIMEDTSLSFDGVESILCDEVRVVFARAGRVPRKVMFCPSWCFVNGARSKHLLVVLSVWRCWRPPKKLSRNPLGLRDNVELGAAPGQRRPVLCGTHG